MTKQEIFDTVARHLLKQGMAAVVRGGCHYRTPSGLKCAAGCLIRDEDYNPSLEGLSTSNKLVQAALPADIRQYADNFIRELQSAHDSELANGGIGPWVEQMRGIAEAHFLNADVLDAPPQA